MPIYEYVCRSCGEKTEVIQRVGEKPLTSCPHCGKRTLKKAVSAPAIQFKGSGWYVTDYARAKKDDSAKGKSDRSDKADKASDDNKAGKSEKVEKSGKSDKPEKSEKSEKKKDAKS
jgi:putative FmdB family regulatory protein